LKFRLALVFLRKIKIDLKQELNIPALNTGTIGLPEESTSNFQMVHNSYAWFAIISHLNTALFRSPLYSENIISRQNIFLSKKS
jgi:hypothetical protein